MILLPKLTLPDGKLELYIEDDAGNANTAIAAARKLADRSKIVSVIGPFSPLLSIAVSDIYFKRKILQMIPGPSVPSGAEWAGRRGPNLSAGGTR